MDSTNNEEILGVLKTEYVVAKNEMSIYISLFHKHSNLTPLMVGALFATVAGAVSMSSRGDISSSVFFNKTILFAGMVEFNAASAIVAILSFSFLILGMFYLSASMGYLYLIELLAQRVRNIEDAINEILGVRVMIWETDVSQKLIRHSHKNFGPLVPNKMRVFWSHVSFYMLWACIILSSDMIMGRFLSATFIVFSIVCGVLQVAMTRKYWGVIVPAVRSLGVKSPILNKLT